MTPKMIFLYAMVTCLLAIGCKNTGNKKEKDMTATPVQTEKIAMGDNTRNSVDWTGTYKGIVPCADCDGIETSLELKRDNTYQLTTSYLGKKDMARQEKGNFSWDASGSVITLQGVANSPTQYKVGEDMVIQYDLQGKEITGNLADKYILRK